LYLEQFKRAGINTYLNLFDDWLVLFVLVLWTCVGTASYC